MSQLKPGGAAPLFAAQEMGVYQQVNGLIVQILALLFSHQDLTAEASLGDELAFYPLADSALAHTGLLGGLLNFFSIIIRQGLVDITNFRQVLFSDLGLFRREMVPQPVTDYL